MFNFMAAQGAQMAKTLGLSGQARAVVQRGALPPEPGRRGTKKLRTAGEDPGRLHTRPRPGVRVG